MNQTDKAALWKREKEWTDTLSQLAQQIAWCELHGPQHDCLRFALGAAEDHALTCLGEVQRTIAILNQLNKGE